MHEGSQKNAQKIIDLVNRVWKVERQIDSRRVGLVRFLSVGFVHLTETFSRVLQSLTSFARSSLLILKFLACDLSGHLEVCQTPDLESSEKRFPVVHPWAKVPGKQPKNTKPAVSSDVLAASRLFFGCFQGWAIGTSPAIGTEIVNLDMKSFLFSLHLVKSLCEWYT